jgi:hypothetical protein
MDACRLPVTKRIGGMTRHTLLLALVLIYTAGFRLLVLDRPFFDDVEGHGAFFGVLARNYLRFEWARTHGVPALTAGQGPDAAIVFYPDHPPLVPMMIAASYRVFGIGDWQTRLPTAIATIAAVALLYLLLTCFGSRRAALIAAALFAAMPMTLYFGGQPEVVGMPLGLFILLSTLGYLHFHEHPGHRTSVPLIVAFTLAGLSDWPAFIIVPVFLVHFLATQPRREWRWILPFAGTACALFASLYIYIALATHAPWDWMVPLFLKHSTSRADAPFTVREWLATALVYNRARHTAPLLFVAGIWLIARAPRVRLQQPGATIARILIAWGILHVLIGRHGVYEHEWWWWPLTPGLAVSAALMIDAILSAVERRRSARDVNAGAALVVGCFALWTGFATFRELYPDRRTDAFTTVELGQAIQAAAPNPNDVVLFVGGDVNPQVWFYGDRLLRLNVWSVDDFKRRLFDDTAEITYGYAQPCKGPGAGLVFPRIWDDDFGDLRVYLQQRYPLAPLPAALADKFEVFDLRRITARSARRR